MIIVSGARHAYPERAGFCMDRQTGYHGEYTFLHFHNRVEMIQDGNRIVSHPHALILYEPDVPQYFHSHEPLVHDWMHFGGDGTALASAAGLPLNTVCYPANPTFITQMMAEIENELFSDRPGRSRMLELKTEELLLKVGRALLQPGVEPYSPKLLEMLRLLRAEVFMSLEAAWTVKQMADRVYLSESRFYAVYKACFGISPTADLIHARMNAAQNRLALGTESVEEIAYSLGYQNVTHFIRQFKAHNGVTPVKYRKDHAG
ncbi:MAG: helix-turn-helix transcriptional regulator [Clostridia bacterium]|nr:helix-turn-helix transcriptional regulator [Clostridia bacterium]